MNERRSKSKVGLIGTGMVGTSFAYSLMQHGVANELVLIDMDAARAEGEMMGLNHGLPFVRPMTIIAGGYDDLADADVIVITAGVRQRPGETRLDLLKKNAAIFHDIVPKIKAVNQDAIIVVASNPVDILTYIAAQIYGLESGRVIGSGTLLDTARFRYLLGVHYGVDSRSVHLRDHPAQEGDLLHHRPGAAGDHRGSAARPAHGDDGCQPAARAVRRDRHRPQRADDRRQKRD